MGTRCHGTYHKYYGTSLDKVFVHSDYQRVEISSINSDFNSENYLQVKIIKEVSPTEYIVADATGFRIIDLEINFQFLWRPNQSLLKENNFVRIIGYRIDYECKKVILKQKTIITKIEEFPVDQINPAYNVSTILAVLSTLVVVNFEKIF